MDAFPRRPTIHQSRVHMKLVGRFGKTSLPVELDAFDVRINVKCRRAEKSDQGLAAFTREIYRERRGCGNGRNDRDSGGEGFLDDLERRTAAHYEDVIMERQGTVEKRPAD